MFDILFLETPQAIQQPEEKEIQKFLSVKMKYSDGTIETENFQNISVFEIIAEDVDVLFWKYKDSEGEVLSEGTSFDTMKNYFETI